ncbi:MAG: hypothetical protein HQL28_02560 [Candidatus Omnitrophica bacterium]|nr:hypothetical protein [Candidatus Omnitrophota bacterium]
MRPVRELKDAEKAKNTDAARSAQSKINISVVETILNVKRKLAEALGPQVITFNEQINVEDLKDIPAVKAGQVDAGELLKELHVKEYLHSDNRFTFKFRGLNDELKKDLSNYDEVTVKAIAAVFQKVMDGIFDKIFAMAKEQKKVDFLQNELWTLRLYNQYRMDMGILSVYLLNLVKLKPGEAMYLPAGELHAYLGKLNPNATDEGYGIELMANSDNVLRGGLTPKHVDVPELSKTLTFTFGKLDMVVTETTAAGELIYKTKAREFELSVIDLEKGKEFTANKLHSADSLIVTAGKAALYDSNGTLIFELEQGETCMVPAVTRAYTIKALEPGTKIYKASLPASELDAAEAFAVRDKDHKKLAEVKKEMAKIHSMNAKLLPAVPEGKTLWLVIQEDLIPLSASNQFEAMVKRMNSVEFKDVREKIIIVPKKDITFQIDQFLRDGDMVSAAIQGGDSANEMLSGIYESAQSVTGAPGKHARALVFDGNIGSNEEFKQLEIIMTALRALYMGNVKAFREIYKMLPGSFLDEGAIANITEEILNNPQKLAQIIRFKIEPIKVEELKQANEAVLEFIHAA